MSDDAIRDLAEKVNEIAAGLAEVNDRIGRNDRLPDDPHQAGRWDQSLYWHISRLSDSMHARANAEHVLIGLLDNNARVSAETSASIVRLVDATTTLNSAISSLSAKLEKNLSYMMREKPFLMRDLWWQPTELFELGLYGVVLAEGVYYLAGSEALLKSALFQGMATLLPYSAAWTGICFALSVGGFAAFFSRVRKYRMLAACGCAVFFIVTGAMPIAAGVLGTLHHLAFGAASLWIVSRGPSNAT